MRISLSCLAALIVVLSYSSCALKQQHVLFEQKNYATIDTQQKAAASINNYRIKPDDILQIRNLQNRAYLEGNTGGTSATATQGQSFQVEEDGRVTLPELGHVLVAGLTRYEAQRKIETLYRDSLLNNPIIELKILNLKVTLLGEVKGPGNYPLLKEHTSLIDVLGEAGGLTTGADEKRIKILRGENHQQVTWIDLSDIKTLSNPQIILENNDIVYVAQNKRAIRDDKLQNFSTLVQPSLLIFNTALIIYTLFR